MIKPLPGYVLIEPIEDEQMSGDVYLPDQSKEKPSKGKVVAISPIMPLSREFDYFPTVDEVKTGSRREAPSLANQMGQLKKGIIVIYKKWTNQEVEHEGKKYLLVHFNELLGVIE